MRCPECKYALWNLKARACPECGRAFTLDEWDFANSDALFACRACGGRLIGHTPEDLPDACSACGEAVERRLVVVERGVTGRDAPPMDANKRIRQFARMACTATMVAGFMAVVLLAVDASDHVVGHYVRRTKPNWVLVTIAMLGINAGLFGARPVRLRRRVALTGTLVALAFVALVLSSVLQDANQARHNLSMEQSRDLRGVTQSMMISMHQTGALPADPQGLIDAGYMPPELFYPSGYASGLSTAPTPLPNGWLTVGEMHIDWDPAAWQPGATAVVAIVYEHTLRPDGLLFARTDGSVDWVSWASLPREIAAWNLDRAAIGLPPIPAGALPPPDPGP